MRVFFACGGGLYLRRDVIDSFGARWKLPLAVGIAAGVGYLFVVVAQARFPDERVWHVTAVALAGLAIWLLIFGIVGLFVRHMEKRRPLVRYVSDASYWMYLTHVAPTAWIPGLLAHVDAPAFVKFFIVVSFTTLITLVTYHYVVRSTVIGELLNGRRYPRALPRLAAREAEV
jgi:hypothetical protein